MRVTIGRSGPQAVTRGPVIRSPYRRLGDFVCRLHLHVPATDGQVNHQGCDGRKENHARDDHTQTQATIGDRLGQVVAARCAKRARQDVGNPECQDRVRFEHIISERNDADQGAENQRRCRIPQTIRVSATRSPAAVPRANVNRMAAQ